MRASLEGHKMPPFRPLLALAAGLWLAHPALAQTTALQSLTLSSARVSGCAGAVTGTVTLTKAAGAGGANVAVLGTTDYTDAPAGVTVAAGKTTATFFVTGKPVLSERTVTISAEYGGVRKSQALTVDPAARFPYRVQAIPTLGGSYSEAYQINARGQVVGTAAVSGIPPNDLIHAYRTDANLNITDLTPALDKSSFGNGINDAGQVVAERLVARNLGALIRVEPDGTWKDYTPASGPDTYGMGINNSGQMTGYQYPDGGSARAYRTDAAGVLTGLGILPKGTYSIGNAINNAGQVAGEANDANAPRAFRTSATGNLATATVLGPPRAAAYGINAAGVITGEFYSTTDSLFHILRATSADDWEDLGTLGGFRAQGNGINTRKDVVGALYSKDVNSNVLYRGAVLYTDAAGLRNLNELIDPAAGWFLAIASGINDAGQITGYGSLNGEVRGFRLTPVGAPFPYGDANRDGALNFEDVKLMLRVAAGLDTPPDLLAADIAPQIPCDTTGFGDGRVDLLDAVRLTRHLAGLEPVWP